MKFRCPLIQEVFSDTQSSPISSFHFLSIHFFPLLSCIKITCPCMSEKAMAPHSSTLAWKIPWTEKPGRLQSLGSLWVGHDWAASLSLFTFITGEGKGNPLQCSCLENPRDGGAWWAAVYGVAQSQTWLKWLSSNRICRLVDLKTDIYFSVLDATSLKLIWCLVRICFLACRWDLLCVHSEH